MGHHRLVLPPLGALPPGVLAMAARGPAWAAYVERLPRMLRDLTEEWALGLDGEPTHGHASLVVPVRRGAEPAVLKLAFPDDESEHEALGLQRWGGDGAVRLLAADPHRRALLLERLHSEDLADLWDLEACEVVAGLYPRLHVPAPPQLRRYANHLARHAEGLATLPRDAPVPRRMVEQVLALLRDLPDPDREVMLHGDLHYANVLAADREPWLAIDPKTMAGDPHAELAPLLWNRWEELAGDVRGGVRRRFHTLVDAAGFDEERARGWVVVRMVLNAYWALSEPVLDREWLTVCVAVAKAVQD